MGLHFIEVVKDFIIQGGNSDSYEISKRRRKIGRYLLPPDTKEKDLSIWELYQYQAVM